MNRIIRDPFTYHFPHIDLHGEQTATVRVIIDKFIQDNRLLKKKEIVIIHGKGTGVLKSTTHEILKKNKFVEKFYLDPQNEGQTIIILKI